MATLPENVGFDTALQYTDKPTRTFIIDWTSNQVKRMDDGLSAMQQAVDIILNNERFDWQIYNSNFGAELQDLAGEEYDYIVSELPRRIEDAFSVDKRILSVEDYVFTNNGNGTMTVTFTVVTVFGSFSQEVIT